MLGLRATNCRTGDVLDQQQVQVAGKEDVLKALTQVASMFRTRVGESLATVERHNTHLERRFPEDPPSGSATCRSSARVLR